MSKKMMKRSLALGALMAFVITGSAMAAEGQNLTPKTDPYVGSVFEKTDGNVTNTLIGDGSQIITIKPNTSNYDGYAYPFRAYGSGASATVAGLKAIVIAGDHYGYDDRADCVGTRGPFYVHAGATLTIGTETEKIGEIKMDDSAKVGTAFNAQGGTMTVNAVKVNLNCDGQALRCNSAPNEVAKINVNADDIVLSGKRAIASFGTGEDTINIFGRNSVTLIGKVQYAITSRRDNTEINIDGQKVYIEGKQGSMYAYDNGVLNVGQKEGFGKADVVGSVYATNGGEVNLNLGNNGSLKGEVSCDISSVININLGSNSTLDISDTGTDNTITTLNGTGTVIVGEGDSVEAGGNAILTVRANGDLAEAIAVKDEAGKTTALEALAGQVTGVTVKQVGTTEGEIAGAITADYADGAVSNIKEAVNTVNKSIGEASVVGMAHIRAHMNDMNKRMGELRMANGEAGVWTRMVRGEEEFAGAKSQYNQYQLGYDEKLSVDKRWTVGAAVTFAEGNGNFANGSTENDSTAFAIYGSKLNNDGTFVDLIARYARFESDITVADAKSDYSTNGMSVSAEFGKRIQQGNGLWIEPQFELTYGTVDSAEYKLGDKTVQVGDMDSLIGRVGFSLGKDIKQGNVYARASYLYDFDGETETTFGNGNVTRTIEEDLGGGWFEVGVGANINLSKATYIYADVEKTFGGEVDTNWKWNLGVRYSF